MQIKISNPKEQERRNSQIPEWVIILMKAYREYANTLEAEDAE